MQPEVCPSAVVDTIANPAMAAALNKSLLIHGLLLSSRSGPMPGPMCRLIEERI